MYVVQRCGNIALHVKGRDGLSEEEIVTGKLLLQYSYRLQIGERGIMTTNILVLFPTSCVVRGQMSLHTHGIQMADGIGTLYTPEAEIANNNGMVYCTHAQKGPH